MSILELVNVKKRAKKGIPSGHSFTTHKTSDKPIGHQVYVRGYELRFPHPEMYKAQANIADKLIAAMDISRTERSVAFLESPTGTGKTLALLTAALGWRERISDKGGLEPLKAFSSATNEEPDLPPSTAPHPSNTSKNMSEAERASVVSAFMMDLSDYEEQEIDTSNIVPIQPFKGVIEANSQHQNKNLSPDKLKEDFLPSNKKSRRKRNHIQIGVEEFDDIKPQTKRAVDQRMSLTSTSIKSSKASESESNSSEPDSTSSRKPGSDSTSSSNPGSDSISSSKSELDSTSSSEGDDMPEGVEKDAPKLPLKSTPTIFYATRTHSQVQKAIGELYNMPYRPTMAALGARDNFCLNSEVNSLPKGSRETACRTSVRRKQCGYYERRDLLVKAPEIQVGPLRIWDLEDLKDLGRSYQSCGYYASKELAKTADIVFCPYNYLVDLAIVAPLDPILRNSVVIIDEAHNIEDMCRTEASLPLSIQVLDGMLFAIENAMALPKYFTRQFASRAHGLLQHQINQLATSEIPGATSSESPEKSQRPQFSLFSPTSAFHTGTSNVQDSTEEGGHVRNASSAQSSSSESQKKKEQLFYDQQRFLNSLASPNITEAHSTKLAHTCWEVLLEVEWGGEMPPMFPLLLFALHRLKATISFIRNWLNTVGRKRLIDNSGVDGRGYAVWKEEELLKVLAEHFKITPFNLREVVRVFEEVNHMIDDIQIWEDERQQANSKKNREKSMDEETSRPNYRGYRIGDEELADEHVWKDIGGWRRKTEHLTHHPKPNWTVFEGSQLSDLSRLFRIFSFMLLNECQYLDDFRLIVEKVKDFGNEDSDKGSAAGVGDGVGEAVGAGGGREARQQQRRVAGQQPSRSSWTAPDGYNIQIHFLCLNAACLFRELIAKTRMVALVSGTLTPFASMRAELGVEPIVLPSGIIQFSTSHIIPPQSKQLMAIRLTHFPPDLTTILEGPKRTPSLPKLPRINYSLQNNALKWNYNLTSDAKAANALGYLLLALLPKVPHGALVFFTSYKHLKFCLFNWNIGDPSIWTALNATKPIFVEPSAGQGGQQTKKLFKDAYEQYMAAVDFKDEEGRSKGACFFGVARGKIAEGIDFADQYARAVFVVGVPNPQWKDPAIEQKREWNSDNFTLDCIRLTEAISLRKAAQATRNPSTTDGPVKSLLDFGSGASSILASSSKDASNIASSSINSSNIASSSNAAALPKTSTPSNISTPSNVTNTPSTSGAPSSIHSSSFPVPPLNLSSIRFNSIVDWHKVDESQETLFLNGPTWYDLQAYRAVNQAIGRCIRHARDYGAILFLDSRYKEPAVEPHISKWARNSICLTTNLLSPVITHLESFYANNKHLDKPPKSSEPPPKRTYYIGSTPSSAQPHDASTSQLFGHFVLGASSTSEGTSEYSDLASSSSVASPFSSAANSSDMHRSHSWSPHTTIVSTPGVQRNATDSLAVSAFNAPARTPPRATGNAFDRLMPSRASVQLSPPPMPVKTEASSSSSNSNINSNMSGNSSSTATLPSLHSSSMHSSSIASLSSSHHSSSLSSPSFTSSSSLSSATERTLDEISSVEALAELSLEGPLLRHPEEDHYEMDGQGFLIPILKSPFIH